MRTVWALKAEFQEARATGVKVQCLATRESWLGIVLFGEVFYNLDYVMRLLKDSMNALQ